MIKSLENMERVMRIELTTRSLGSYCSTTELHPHLANILENKRLFDWLSG